MTQDQNDASKLIASTKEHATLDAWLKGKGIDDAHKAMNKSAVSKKPGRVTKRVGKALGDLFNTPRVVAWDKEKKTVYAAALSHGEVSEVVMSGDYDIPDGVAVFQTDLYFRANKEVTEVNASTVAGIRGKALSELLALRSDTDEDADKIMRVALTLGRIFQTGLKESGLSENETYEFLLPYGEDAMVVLALPIERIEFDERLVGQVVLVSGVIPAADITQQERELLDEMKVALSREGHPGAEAFGKMVSARAKTVDTSRF